ncbi:GntR family transcriptional regulator [Sandarakinorhabdus sp. AAP62]|uniref:GntR family transcriptional regulator n=1 Tax=Sandarakinorhabdus sp. AAP62 TaxID=1248916 RepID=UPI0002E96DA6|nr:GntR family transcriptional regulator [Sandarakinorhabdus sp. AAP62]
MPGNATSASHAAASAADRAYAEIRGLILAGDASPGTPLREEALADIVGVSRTPIRDALRRLEAELYAVRTPGGRLVVADWNIDDVVEIFALRAMLEGHAAARAARRITASQLAELRSCNAAIEAAVANPEPDIAGFLAGNRRFHDLVLAASASVRLATMLTGLVEQPIVRRTATRYDRSDLARSAHEHGQLIQAFAARDEDWARAVMTAHIRRALHAFQDASPSK